MSPFRIVIVGGGIAGFAAAIALRGPNRQIIVLEQSRLNKEIGALISLQPNASRIFQSSWGVDLSRARAMVDEGFRIYNTDGYLVNTVPLLSRTEYEADRLVFHRRDLHDLLRHEALSSSPIRAGEPVEVRTASRVASCDPVQGTVTLEGGETVTGDLIVGADGIHSVLRKHVLQEEPLAKPTGHSEMIPTEVLESHEPEFCSKINPREPFTSMMVAHDCRLVMGPGRQREVYGIVALVPDEQLNEDPNAKQSWVSEGHLDKMLEAFAEYPPWDPLRTWHRGRVILIGDAAHAMLPTQGQGASQAIEDAEALGAFFEGVDDAPLELMDSILEDIFQARHSRVSLIQAYSRQAAKPATAKGDKTVTMTPEEFMDFNCMYRGAKAWKGRMISLSA
ncbi:FAD/NAD(P)-binding domain-containing protein [Aspergillus ellipticus CBS 707.79]|uniref:FAD/NAD(P)-binding domain-containing protein n=1 Tax=Aspergillus ellipticus CBS 707.79 TaxID=1448320 RepID=A0A319DAC3_9EURO|nr:FAD/NAD(P)-binding domain-containing protein [Aspergillus ellipticus CBS 707.79]